MSFYIVLLLYFIQWMTAGETLLFKPRAKCVPTAAVQGPCHHCVCSTQGVYHCVLKKCDRNLTEPIDDENECEPSFTYAEKAMICSCSKSGRWKSFNCRNRFRFIQRNTTPTNQILRTNIACTPYMLYLIDCNICRCETDGILKQSSCTNRPCSAVHKSEKCKAGDIQRFGNELCACSDVNYFIDRLCFPVNDNSLQTVENIHLEKLVYADSSWRRMLIDNNRCNQSVTFTIDCNTCVCSNFILNCTKKNCSPEKGANRAGEIRTSEVLPELENGDEKCTPGKKYKYKCNICVCADDGLPTCTTMVCLEDFLMDVPGVKGSLRTNGKSNVSNIARSLPEIQEGDKCVPGERYKMDCNTCYCKKDGSLMCTKVLCLSPKYMNMKKDARKMIKQVKNETKSIAPTTGSKKGKNKFFELQEAPETGCVPGKIYKKGCQKCFCDDKGETLCTKKNNACKENTKGFRIRYLEDIRPPLQPGEVHYLQELPTRQVECVPGNSYRVDCNGCVCLASKNLICDDLICLSYDDMHRIEADEKSKSPCKPEEYKKTEEDCIVCDCVKGKVKCTEVTGCISNKDKQMLNWNDGDPKLSLDMFKETCIPGAVYRMDCNNCYCQKDSTLRCTQKTCLNYSQAKALEKQRLFLLQNGL